MFERIVLPVDGSDLAEQALPAAEDLARLAGVPIHVVRVVDLGKLAGQGDWTFGAAPGALQRIVDAEQRAAGEYVARVTRDLTHHGLKESSEWRLGRPAQELVAATREGDLIVMATHGRDGVPRWFLGSVAEEVARRSPAPVMLVPATTETS